MESLSDIVAQIRAAAYIQNADPPKSVLRLADRIEAAWRRDEERAVEHATRHAEAVARDNCRDCIHNPNGKNYEHVGNAAAMREALEDIVGIAKIALNVNCVGNSNDSELWNIIDKAKAALSAPPRACDLIDAPVDQIIARWDVAFEKNARHLPEMQRAIVLESAHAAIETFFGPMQEGGAE